MNRFRWSDNNLSLNSCSNTYYKRLDRRTKRRLCQADLLQSPKTRYMTNKSVIYFSLYMCIIRALMIEIIYWYSDYNVFDCVYVFICKETINRFAVAATLYLSLIIGQSCLVMCISILFEHFEHYRYSSAHLKMLFVRKLWAYHLQKPENVWIARKALCKQGSCRFHQYHLLVC
jgi:hypothetical protein